MKRLLLLLCVVLAWTTSFAQNIDTYEVRARKKLSADDLLILQGKQFNNTTASSLTDKILATKEWVEFLVSTASSDSTKAPLASPALTGVPTAPTAAIGTSTTQLATTAFVNAEIANNKDLTAIEALTGTSGLLKKIAANTWALDANSYLTGNQTITMSGDVTGSGTTAITTTLSNSGITAGTYNNSATSVTPITFDAKGRATGVGSAVTITPAWSNITSKPTTLSGFGITAAATDLTDNSDLVRISAAQTLQPKSFVSTVATNGILAYESGFLPAKTKVYGYAAQVAISGGDNNYQLAYLSDTYGGIANYQVNNNALIFEHFNTSDTYLGSNYLVPFGGFAMSSSLTATPIGMWQYSNNNKIAIGKMDTSSKTAGTTTVIVDATNSYVGINKVSPTVALDVVGAITATGTVTAPAFAGNATTATTATNSTMLQYTTSGNYPLLFSTSITAGNKGIFHDSDAGVYINPSTNALGATTFIGALSGNATTATSATSATTSTTATNLAAGSAYSVPYQSASGTTAFLAAGTAGYVLKTNSTTAAPAWGTLTKTDVGLSAVENTTLSTWGGSTNIASVGTITAGTWTGNAVGVAYGGTGAATAASARTNLGATTVGGNVFTSPNPNAIAFLRAGADNTISWLNATDFRTAIGAGTSSTTGTVTSVSASSPTGLDVTVTNATTTPNIALVFASGYSIPTTANQTNWGYAYTYSQIGHLPLAGGTLTGALNGTSATFIGTVTAPTIVGALTGNASTATKLATARTLWGQSFDGSANVTGDISLGNSQLIGGNAFVGDLDTYFPATAGGIRVGSFTAAATNKPVTYDNANGIITINTANSAYFHQLAFPNDGNIYWRRNNNGTLTSWSNLWSSNNSNLTTKPWSASNLTLAGSIAGATTIAASGLATLSGGISSTSASFSGTVTAPNVVYGDNAYAASTVGAVSLNTLTKSGFYYAGSTTTDIPSSGSHEIIHSNYTSSALWAAQLAFNATTGGTVYFRNQVNGTWQSWKQFYHSENANLTTVDWSAKNLTLVGAITGATTIATSGNVAVGGTLTSTGLGTFNAGITSTTITGSGTVTGNAVNSNSNYQIVGTPVIDINRNLINIGSAILSGNLSTKTISSASQTITYSATPTMPVNSGMNGVITLTGNVTSLTLTGLSDGTAGDIVVVQNATGGYGINAIVASGLTVKYINNAAPSAANLATYCPTGASANGVVIISYKVVGSYLLINYGGY